MASAAAELGRVALAVAEENGDAGGQRAWLDQLHLKADPQRLALEAGRHRPVDGEVAPDHVDDRRLARSAASAAATRFGSIVTGVGSDSDGRVGATPGSTCSPSTGMISRICRSGRGGA
jgi:hypothetical protein